MDGYFTNYSKLKKMIEILRSNQRFELVRDNLNKLWCVYDKQTNYQTNWSNDLELLNNFLSLSKEQFNENCLRFINNEQN